MSAAAPPTPSTTPTVKAASPLSVVLTSGVAYAAFFAAIGAWSPYWPVYFSGLGVDLAAIGLLTAIPAAVQIVFAPTWGLAADRLGDVRPPLVAAAAIAIGAAGVGAGITWLGLGGPGISRRAAVPGAA